jgi:hypothetical protein
MKTRRLCSLAAIALLILPSCDRKSPDLEKRIAELEKQKNEATDKQRELAGSCED